MSIPRGYPNKGNLFSNLVGPVKVDCQFVVAVADTGGLGITSLKSNGYVQNVYMHTSATPATGSPNPASGIVMVRLKNNFNKCIGLQASIQAPVTGSEISISGSSVLTAGQVYQITTLGTTTQAQWVTAGLPAGFTPALGQSFVSKIAGGGTGTGKVKALSVSGIQVAELMGNANLELNNSNIHLNAGAVVIAQLLGATGAGTTTLIPKAPADGSVINLSLYFDNSSVTVDGL